VYNFRHYLHFVEGLKSVSTTDFGKVADLTGHEFLQHLVLGCVSMTRENVPVKDVWRHDFVVRS
jgi:hypothetical protein